jgi:hypothetical protein
MRGTQDGVWEIDLVTNATLVRPALRGNAGLQSRRTRALARVFEQLLHPDDRDRAQDSW